MPTKKPKPDLVKAADNFSRKYEDVFGDKDPQDIINELRGDGDVSGASMNSSGESAAREQWRHKENSMTKPEAEPWRRQEACPECDGDGCAACRDEIDVCGEHVVVFAKKEDCDICHTREHFEKLPATPAPSQPAVTNRFCTRCGKLNDHTHDLPTRDRHDRPAFTGCCGTPTTGLSYVNPQHRADCPLRTAPSQPAGARECRCNCNPWCGCVCHEQKLDQQTAAKDAEIERLNERWDKAARNIVCAYCGTDTPVDIRDQEARLNAMLAHSEVCEKSPVKQMLDAMERAEAAERERDSLREANARLAADLDAALKAGKESHGA